MFEINGKKSIVVDVPVERPVFYLDRGEQGVALADQEYIENLAFAIHHEEGLGWSDCFERVYVRTPGDVGLQEVTMDIVERRDRPGQVVHARNKLTGIAIVTWEL